jgi:outer membrane protein OmpA-like peptidoglycan-associated protein
MKYFILSVFFSLALFTAFGQKDQSAKDLFLDAEYYRLYEEYEEALPLYQRLISEGYDNAHINYRTGECYLKIPGKKTEAIPYLRKAVEGISKNFKEGSFKEKSAPVYAIFYLGKAYQMNNQLDKALEQYETFINRLEDKDKYNMSFVNKQIESCRTAKKLMQNPIHISKKNLGKKINSQYPNNRPVVSPDESKIIYNSELKFYDAVFMAEKDSTGKWGPPKNLTPQLQSEGDFYSSSISNKGNKLILFKSNPYNGDIFISNYNNEKKKWEKPEKLGKNINSKFWETHACLANDGKTIYFTSNRKGGVGGLDIYYSNYNEKEGIWGPARNLGAKINTPYNEETPFLTENGNRLYFSSQGHKGMGGFDIFYAEKISKNEWSEPVNIGHPINTTGDDLFFYPVNNGQAGYISRYDKDGFGKQDIMRIEIYSPENPKHVELKGKVNIREKKSPNGQVSVKIDSLNGKTLKEKSFSASSNVFHFNQTITPGNYTVNIESDGYLTIKKHISIGWEYNRDTFELNADLIPKEEKIAPFTTLKNVYFDYDSDTLTTETEGYLNQLIKIMEKHPELKIEIIGHTDAKGPVQYNKNLSGDRAGSVSNYLLQKGISEDRITQKGKGEKYPIALNTYQDGKDCPEGRRYNRRVEFKPLSSKDKSIISQYNVVPNQLRIRENTSYYVLIAEKDEQLSKEYFSKYPSLKKYKIEEVYSGKYFYLLGHAENQAKAIEPYRKAVKEGFREARIISNYQLEDILDLNYTESTNDKKKIRIIHKPDNKENTPQK